MRRLTEDDLKKTLGTTQQGYCIEAARVKRGEFTDSDHYGIVLGRSDKTGYVTWQFHIDDGEPSFYWEHYIENREAAMLDYNNRDLDVKPQINSNTVPDFERLISHVGHGVEFVVYGDKINISIECADCCEVLYSLDNPTNIKTGRICARCKAPVYLSDNPNYAYQCIRCDEDLYAVETEEIKANSENDCDTVKGHEPGVCPHCGSDNLDFDGFIVEDGCCFYRWDCKACGVSGRECYDLTFTERIIDEQG